MNTASSFAAHNSKEAIVSLVPPMSGHNRNLTGQFQTSAQKFYQR